MEIDREQKLSLVAAPMWALLQRSSATLESLKVFYPIASNPAF
jgi:hypothetical protein